MPPRRPQQRRKTAMTAPSPLPPTSLLLLVWLSSSLAGGVILTGYDDAFIVGLLYHSHLDSASSRFQTIDKDEIALSAILLAR